MMLQMINVGEATGTLDEMLNKLADFYDEEVDTAVAALLSILEPILLIFVGGHGRRPGRLDVPADLQPDAEVLEDRGKRGEEGSRCHEVQAVRAERTVERRSVLLYNIYRLVVLTSLLVSALIIQLSSADSAAEPALLLSHHRRLRLLGRLLRPLRLGPAARRPGLSPGRLRPPAHHRLRLHLGRARLVDVLPLPLPDHGREPGHLRPGRLPGRVAVGHPLRRPRRRPLLRVHPRLPARARRPDVPGVHAGDHLHRLGRLLRHRRPDEQADGEPSPDAGRRSGPPRRSSSSGSGCPRPAASRPAWPTRSAIPWPPSPARSRC